MLYYKVKLASEYMYMGGRRFFDKYHQRLWLTIEMSVKKILIGLQILSNLVNSKSHGLEFLFRSIESKIRIIGR